MIRTDYAQPPKPIGIVCPRCGGAKLPAVSTRRRGAKMIRLRRCAAAECGYKIRTVESVYINAEGKR